MATDETFLDYCIQQRAKAQRGLDAIKRGIRYHEAIGNGMMTDVTSERKIEWQETIRQLAKVITEGEAVALNGWTPAPRTAP